MTTDIAFLIGVPVFVLLSCIQHRFQGLVFSLVMAATTWLVHETVGGLSMMDMPDNSFAIDFRTIAHAAAIGGALVAAIRAKLSGRGPSIDFWRKPRPTG